MRTESMATPHHGRNVKRIREILGIKQEALAMDLGISQQAISALEQKEALDKDMLEKVANALKVPAEAIKNFDEQAVVTNISCNFHDFHDNASVFQFNPVEKIVELYERLLIAEKEKVAMLERLLENRK